MLLAKSKGVSVALAGTGGRLTLPMKKVTVSPGAKLNCPETSVTPDRDAVR
ncbi:MAG: hypothetical protein R3E83_21240 [Burkholderiaceae bacterium]